ncbi:MAG: hypothetical protein U0Z44_19420 [Kouleothrix sp.]
MAALEPIPIVAVSGGDARYCRAYNRPRSAMGQPNSLAVAAGFDATRDLLSDARGAIAVLGLSADGIAQRGLALERCAYSAIVDLPGDLPAGIADHAELARVLGVPMHDHRPGRPRGAQRRCARDCSAGRCAPPPLPDHLYRYWRRQYDDRRASRPGWHGSLCARGSLVIAAHGAAEQAVLQATLPPAAATSALAAIALHAIGLSWEQIRGDRA